MDGKEGMDIGVGVTVKGDEAPEIYRVVPRADKPGQLDDPVIAAADAVATAAAAIVSPVCVTAPSTELKKKRGRPRKHGPDGKVSMALSPMPISSSIPFTLEFSTWKPGKDRPIDSKEKLHKHVFEGSGDKVEYFVGANFTPHMITVNSGEDITMKVMSFSQQGSRAICVLSANGVISSVTLRQPTSSGGTLTYEGRFEILSLSGSYMPTESGGTKSRSGGMSISLAGPDGRVVGGGLAGLLVAAGPVQVVLGSFLPGHQQEHKSKKQRTELHASPVVKINSISGVELRALRSVTKEMPASISFGGDDSPFPNPIQKLRNPNTDNNISFAEVSC